MALFRRKRATSFEDPIVAESGPSVVRDDGRAALSGREVLGFEDPIVAKEDFEVPVFDEEEPGQP